MRRAVAVDLGTSRTRLADVSGRLLVDEPSVAAVDLVSGRLVAYGERAVALAGRSAGAVGLVRPVVHGQLQDLRLTDQVVAHLLERSVSRAGRHPEVLCTVPGLASGVQRRALERAFKAAGAGHVEFIEHPVAIGIGLRLRIDEPVATMVVDVGGGTTDVAVMALGGVVTEASLPIGGRDLDRAVSQLCLRSFDLVIDSAAAEEVTRAIGTAWPAEETKVDLAGRSVGDGTPRQVTLSSSEVAGALAEPLSAIVAAAVGCIVASPPDLSNDLVARGLHLAGEGALLAGFTRRLATATGIPVHLAAEPGTAAVLGAARCLRELVSDSPA